MRRLAAYLIIALCAALPAMAQDDGGGFLERMLEDALSGEDRDVAITGFAGALSSRATIEEMTFSDADGIWLSLRDVTLDWNRAALLRGRVEVEELTAAEIDLPRPPLPADTPTSAEAQGFSLPELPVSVEIGRVAASRVSLGAPILGLDVVFEVEGSLTLADGEGSGLITATRLDGATGTFSVEGAYSNATGVLTVAAGIDEGPDGILATLLTLPGGPSVALEIEGTGSLDDFAADLALATDGQDRLTGRLEIADDGFRADLGGDVAPLFLPDYQNFFGTDVALRVSGARLPEGGTRLDEMTLNAAQLELAGAVTVGPDGLPDLIDVSGRVRSETGEPVLLPISGAPVSVGEVTLSVAFDAGDGERWTADVTVDSFDRPGLLADRITLRGGGRISPLPVPLVTANLDIGAEGLDLGDPAAEAALGEAVTGRVSVWWRSGEPVEVTALTVTGESYGLDGRATITPLEGGVDLSANLGGTARDLSVFSGLAGRPLTGSLTLEVEAEAQPVDGTFRVSADGRGAGLSIGILEVDQLLEGDAALGVTLRRDTAGTFLDRFAAQTGAAEISAEAGLSRTAARLDATARLIRTDIIAPDVPGPVAVTLHAEGPPDLLAITANLDGPELAATLAGDLDLSRDVPSARGTVRATVAELRPFSPRAGRPLSGRAEAAVEGQALLDLSAFDLGVAAKTTDIAISVPQADTILQGVADLAATVTRTGNAVRINSLSLDSPALEVTGEGEVALQPGAGFAATGGRITARGTLRRTAGLVEGLPAPVAFETTLDGADAAWTARAAAEGPGLTMEVSGTADLGETPAASGTVALAAIDISPFSELAGRPLTGALELNARGSGRADLSAFDVDGTLRSTDLSIGHEQVDQLLAGAASVSVDADRSDGTIRVRAARFDSPALTAEATAEIGEGTSRAEVKARLDNAARFVPGLPGPAALSATATRATGDPWQVTAQATGPGGSRAEGGGTVADDLGSVNLALSGALPLEIANGFIEPRAVSGQARFDIRVDGPPALDSVAGTVTTREARFVAPALGVTLTGLGADIGLTDGRASIDAGAAFRTGGRLAASGTLGLTPPFSADLRTQLQSAVLTDPVLYETTVNGGLTVTGPLTGGARIAGDLTLSETEIRIPSGAVGGVNAIPDIVHLNEPRDVRATRARAGLMATPGSGGGAEGSGPAHQLSLTVRAPSRIFIRGRGLEAELGGTIRLGGTTRAVIPTGRFELIRGRLDILGQRLTLDEGSATLQGDFDPVLRLVAATQSGETQIQIVVEGTASEPEIRFLSQPELPQDEVLARLLFGRGVDSLSPLQAAQLASAVATLAGRGGDGIVGRLRQNFGLDDLDVTGDGQGGVGVRAGKYISDNVYTDVEVDSVGEAEVTINLDLTPSVTVRGRASNTGETGIGVFFERDY